ncbi:lipopolysaccharide biosynthesis protein [Microbulbifer elongatus]|uniref:lipopolysaccharide biosynthesis protein n=1 Tax=Microbulbifer elongatus TaxID=86173 RepID=UPI001E368EA5|nr:hypothetical protein [Microbulbifer elongatus]
MLPIELAAFSFKVLAVAALLSSCLRFGADNYLAKRVAEVSFSDSGVIAASMYFSYFLFSLLSYLLFLGLIFIAWQGSHFFSWPLEFPVFFLYGVALAFPFSIHWLASLVFHGFGWYSSRSLFQFTLFNVLVLVGLLYLHFRYLTLTEHIIGGSIVFSSWLVAVLSLGLLHKSRLRLLSLQSLQASFKSFKQSWLDLLRQSFPLLGGVACLAAINALGVFSLSIWSDSEDVAIFSIVQRVAAIVLIVQMPIVAVFVRNAAVLRAKKVPPKVLTILLLKCMGGAGVMMFCVALFMLFFGRYSIAVLVPDYVGLGFGVGLQLLLVGMVLYGLSGFFVALLTVLEKLRIVLVINVSALFVLAVSLALLVPKFGVLGAVVSYIVSFSVLFAFGASATKASFNY